MYITLLDTSKKNRRRIPCNCTGHIQRGGTPTARDRIIASQMGCYAVDLLEQGIGNRVVIQKNAKIIDYDILEALTMKKGLDRGLLEVNQIINI